ncbi:MAG: hypothetical protein MZU91_08625 [Desulfosudis oleivorans]|nr:hypothetical protein [Desulfosudis oleivorans]
MEDRMKEQMPEDILVDMDKYIFTMMLEDHLRDRPFHHGPSTGSWHAVSAASLKTPREN